MKARAEPHQQGPSSRGDGGSPPATESWRARGRPLREGDNQKSRRNTRKGNLGNDTKASKAEAFGLAWGRILVPIDFSAESTRALKIASHLGRSDEGNLLLVHVVGPIYDLGDFGYGPVQRQRPNEGLMRHARQRLQALGRRHVGEKMPWRCVVRSGTAPREILKMAEEFHAELVVMPTRGLSHAPPTEMGSTAERVVRHALCPVLVLPSQPARKKPNS